MEINKEEIRSALLTLFGEDYFAGGGKAILYGSRLPLHDIDIIVIQSDLPTASHLAIGRLDLFVVTQERFDALIKVLDPIAVEPVLTGEMLFGDQKDWTSLNNIVSQMLPERSCWEHACRRSIEETLSANRFWQEYRKERSSELLQWAFQNLSFAISYMAFARYYAQPGSRPCTLTQLIKDGEAILPEFWEYLSGVKKGDCKLDGTTVEEWMNKWFRSILNI